MNILVTGFDTFQGGAINPSWEMIKNLPPSLGEHKLIIEKLPVVYSTIKGKLENLITLNKPDLVIMFGLADSILYPKIESYGWNHAGTGADNDGVRLNAPLVNSADARIGYKATYNYYDALRWMGNNDFNIQRSLDGGSYLCNAAIYYTGYILEQKGLDIPYFFSHVPNEKNLSISDAEQYAMLIIKGMINENSHHKIDFSPDFDFASTLTFTNKSNSDYDASTKDGIRYKISPATFSERTILKFYGEFESRVNNNPIMFYLQHNPTNEYDNGINNAYGHTHVTLNKGVNRVTVYLEVPPNIAIHYVYLDPYKGIDKNNKTLNILIKSSTVALGTIDSEYRPINKVKMGAQGIEGLQGPQGIQGPKGEQGPQGLPGQDGQDADLTDVEAMIDTRIGDIEAALTQVIGGI